MTPSRVPYLFVTGTSYSGSTLLSFLLNAHPQMVCFGEPSGPIGADPDYACSCGRKLLECDRWSALSRRMDELGAPLGIGERWWKTNVRLSENRYWNFLGCRSLGAVWLDRLRDRTVGRLPAVRRPLAEIARTNAALAQAALELTGARLYVDAGKNEERIAPLARAPGIDLSVVHLVRDVRGATASFMKNGGLSLEQAASRWQRGNLDCERARTRLHCGRWLTVRYSELCADVQQTLDTIARFAGLAPAEVPADFRDSEHHILGNRMRLGSGGVVREDASWREKLSEEQLRTLVRLAGATNRHFGYDWPSS